MYSSTSSESMDLHQHQPTGNTVSCGCTSKRHSSPSLLTKIVGLTLRHRRSSATFETEFPEDSGAISSSNSSETSDDNEGSCLKIRTQHESLNRSYGHSQEEDNNVGLSISDDAPQDEDAPRRTRVQFGQVEVLVFPLALGDNPSVSVGPPLCLGRKVHARLSVSMEDYESTRPPRRCHQELAVPRPIREDWLREEGYSRGELKEVEEELLSIKKSRKHNASLSPLASTSKLFIRLFSASSKSKKRTSVLRK